MRSTLIIAGSLINPPTESLAFRFVNLQTKEVFHTDNLIEIPKDILDIYYGYMRVRGMMDYVDQIIKPEEQVDGVRIDTANNFPLTICTDRICFHNLVNIIGQLGFLLRHC